MKRQFSNAEMLRRKEKKGLGLRGGIVAIALLILSGCTMAPEYTRPEAPIPSEWPSGPAYKASTADTGERSATEITWQEFFIDKQLQKLIVLALENNRDLRIAALNIEKTQALYRIQRAELLPSVNAGAIFSKERVPGILSGSGHPATEELYNVNLGISSWELDIFGRIRSLKDAALQEYLATEQARRSTQISLVAEVANTYLTLAADRELLKLAQETLGAQEATYNLIRRRYEVGASS